eukprot:4803443-Pyramimonas_sp.AAC.1
MAATGALGFLGIGQGGTQLEVERGRSSFACRASLGNGLLARRPGASFCARRPGRLDELCDPSLGVVR